MPLSENWQVETIVVTPQGKETVVRLSKIKTKLLKFTDGVRTYILPQSYSIIEDNRGTKTKISSLVGKKEAQIVDKFGVKKTFKILEESEGYCGQPDLNSSWFEQNLIICK